MTVTAAAATTTTIAATTTAATIATASIAATATTEIVSSGSGLVPSDLVYYQRISMVTYHRYLHGKFRLLSPILYIYPLHT